MQKQNLSHRPARIRRIELCFDSPYWRWNGTPDGTFSNEENLAVYLQLDGNVQGGFETSYNNRIQLQGNQTFR